MRETLLKHFDVVVVVWALALAVGWSFVVLSRTPLPSDQWSGGSQVQSGWVFADGAGR